MYSIGRQLLYYGFGIACAAPLCGCASSGSQAGRPTTTETVRVAGGGSGALSLSTTGGANATGGTVSYALADVWRVLPAVYDSFGIPRTHADAASYVLGNAGIKIRRQLGGVRLSRFIDCGNAQGGSSADEYEVSFAINTQLGTVDAHQTSVATVIEASARPIMFAGEQVRCSSTGVLEQRLVAAIGAELAKK